MEQYQLKAFFKSVIASEISPLKAEISNLKSQLGTLQQQLAEKDRQLEVKDQRIANLERQLAETADLERQIQELVQVPNDQRQEAEQGILRAIYDYLRNHPVQTAFILIATGTAIAGFLVYMGLPIITASVAGGTASATSGTAAAATVAATAKAIATMGIITV